MLLFPPFQIHAGNRLINAGYSFILDPPNDGEATVNGFLLLIQWVG